MGGMYYVIPRIYDCKIYSRVMANVQYSLYVVGFLFFFLGFLLTGVVQGSSWVQEGLPVYTVLPGLRSYMAMRAAGGALLVTSFLLFGYNVFATVIKRVPVQHPEPVAKHAADHYRDPRPAGGRGLREAAMRMSFRLIIIGGLIVFFAVLIVVVFVPNIIWNPPQTLVAQDYSGLEAQGRELFYSNGCNYCHTQYVRAEDTAMGAVSQGGDYVFDNPMILGSERTGPDLSYVGRKRGEAWEIAHLKSPRDYSPNSIMPRFDFLSDEQLKAIAAYLFSLGDRVAQSRMITPPSEYAGLTNPFMHARRSPRRRQRRWVGPPGSRPVFRRARRSTSSAARPATAARATGWARTGAPFRSPRPTTSRSRSARCPTTSSSGTSPRGSRARSCPRGSSSSPRSSAGRSSATSSRPSPGP